jgi:hypothetical protein
MNTNMSINTERKPTNIPMDTSTITPMIMNIRTSIAMTPAIRAMAISIRRRTMAPTGTGTRNTTKSPMIIHIEHISLLRRP